MRCSRRSPRARAALTLSVLLVCVAAGCKRPLKAPGTGGASAETDRDPPILVVVHSWTGRTARAGEEIARMVRGRLVVARDPPRSGPGGGSVRPEEALEALLRGGVNRGYLGFPIWNEAPARRPRSSSTPRPSPG